MRALPPPPRVPVLCPGGTVVCIGGGPSLTVDDIEYVRGKVDAVVAVNDAYKLAPWATALVALDGRWWKWQNGAADFEGLRITNDRSASVYPGVLILKHAGADGIDTEPTQIRSGGNSGFAAINVAVHLGARRVVLLGYDLQPGPNGERNFHDDHAVKGPQKFAQWLAHYNRLPAVLARLGVEVINCTPRTALTCFPQAPLRETLRAEVAA
jgi:hypothetical protein